MKRLIKKILASLMAVLMIPISDRYVSAAAGGSQLPAPVNLVQGLKYSFTAFDPLHPDHTYDMYEDTNHAELTDGVYGDPTNYKVNGAAPWTGFNGWKGTTTDTVQFDLGTEKSVASFVSDFYAQDNEDGIAPPAKVTVFLSDNGEDWVTAAQTKSVADMKTITLQQRIKARYVKLDYLHGNTSSCT